MDINYQNDATQVLDQHYALRCPHCGVQSNITAISIPRYELAMRYQPAKLGIVYRCDSCNDPVYMQFEAIDYQPGNNILRINQLKYQEVQKSHETFDYKYLSVEVADNFREALTCYSNACYNAFAGMCRRTVQTIFTELGASGKDKVLAQLRDVRETASLDDEAYSILEQVTLFGHDGAHPNLPKLSPERVTVMLELMKDILYQLFVRKGKIQESIELRKKAIQSGKADPG